MNPREARINEAVIDAALHCLVPRTLELCVADMQAVMDSRHTQLRRHNGGVIPHSYKRIAIVAMPGEQSFIGLHPAGGDPVTMRRRWQIHP